MDFLYLWIDMIVRDAITQRLESFETEYQALDRFKAVAISLP